MNNFVSFFSIATTKLKQKDGFLSDTIENSINNLKKDYDIIIKIFDKIENEPFKIRETLNSDFFLIVSIKNKVTKDDLIRINKAIGEKINNCLLGLFVH